MNGSSETKTSGITIYIQKQSTNRRISKQPFSKHLDKKHGVHHY